MSLYPSVPRPQGVATAAGGRVCSAPAAPGRLFLKGGYLVDPKNGREGPFDLALEGDRVAEAAPHIDHRPGDRVVDCRGLLVLPGLIDMHLHMGDLFEVSTAPIQNAVCHGVTAAFTPGAGNTFMAPALFGGEFDRGLPLSGGCYLGAASLLACQLDDGELTAYFAGDLPWDTALQKLSRAPLTAATGALVMGVKDHMGHLILSDAQIERLFAVTSRARLLLMSHTQDPAHAERMAALSKGRPLYLGHASAAGCGTHAGGTEGMRRVLALCRQPNITGELVSSMLRPGRGNREGLRIDPQAQALCFEALADGTVSILCSDGQGDCTMKGFGDTRDNLPAILELAENGVLPLSRAVATMTQNPAAYLSEITGVPFFAEKLGQLGAGARANVVLCDQGAKRAVCTIVNGEIAAFEGRCVRSGAGAGRFLSHLGEAHHFGVGNLPLWDRAE